MTKTATKRGNLFGSAVPDPIPAAPARVEEEAPARKYPRAKTRDGKRSASCYLTDEASEQLRILGIRERTTVEALLREGLNEVFAKRGLSRIA